MKTEIERRKPEGIKDYLALAVTTCGVGYFPLAPGTWGSLVGVLIFVIAYELEAQLAIYYLSTQIDVVVFKDSLLDNVRVVMWVVNAVLLFGLTMVGIWASNRSISLLGNSDPPEAVIDEVVGQILTFTVLPYGILFHPAYLIVGFLLFRLFDIWKPYPIYGLQDLPGGLGICADDIVAGVYAGICLAVIYALSLFIF